MPNNPDLLIALADGTHLRLVRRAQDNALHTESNTHHADHSHDHTHEAFARRAATAINEAASHCQELLIAAPAHTLGTIHAHLSHQAAARLIGTVSKDLTRVPDHELQPHLSHWVHPIHRPIGLSA